VRFPEAGVWNLPVAAHEYGHFIADRVEAEDQRGAIYHPVRRLLDREASSRRGTKVGREEDEDARRRHYVQELFADLFATFALGPAYACTCIMRWNPQTAYVDGDRHPSPAKRVEWILKVLEAMNEGREGGGGAYSSVIRRLRSTWQLSLQVMGRPETMQEYADSVKAASRAKVRQDVAELDRWFRELYDAVGKNPRLVDIRYQGQRWRRAANRMEPQLRKRSALTAGEDDRIVDVLNAAWWGRISHAGGRPREIQRIGKRAVEWCQQIIAHG
jgi:hypothetical protein